MKTIQFLGTKEQLFSIINKGNIFDADYVIAMYLLKNWSRLRQINIYDMAAACYVDRSTIRRFFDKMNDTNFREFKSGYNDYFKTDEAATMGCSSYTEYLTKLAEQIISYVDHFKLRRDKDGEIEWFVDRLHRADNVVFMGSESIGGQMLNAQNAYLVSDKIIHVITQNVQNNSLLNHLDEGDLILIFSLRCRYANIIYPTIEKNKAKKILFTLYKTAALEEQYDKVIPLSNQSLNIEEDVIRKYGYTYLMDTMTATYRIRYKTPSSKEE